MIVNAIMLHRSLTHNSNYDRFLLWWILYIENSRGKNNWISFWLILKAPWGHMLSQAGSMAYSPWEATTSNLEHWSCCCSMLSVSYWDAASWQWLNQRGGNHVWPRNHVWPCVEKMSNLCFCYQHHTVDLVSPLASITAGPGMPR